MGTNSKTGHLATLACTIWAVLLLFMQGLWLSLNDDWRDGWTGIGVFPFVLLGVTWEFFESNSLSGLLLGLTGVAVLFLLSAGIAYASAASQRLRTKLFPAILGLMLIVAAVSWLPMLPAIMASPYRVLLLGLLASNLLFFAAAVSLHLLAERRHSSALGLSAGLVALTWMLTTMTAPLDLSSGWY